MRQKSLVVAASGPFTGPWVNLEAGEWLVELPVSGGGRLETYSEEEVEYDGNVATVTGPARVRVVVFEGHEVFIQARQLTRA